MPRRHDGFKNFVLDQLSDLRDLTCRAMFGGYGLYQGTRFFGIIHKGRVYFKVSPMTIDRYKDHGMKAFRPNPKQTLKSFYEVPVDVVEDTEQLADWAEQSAKR
jgi:DNA transformation protein